MATSEWRWRNNMGPGGTDVLRRSMAGWGEGPPRVDLVHWWRDDQMVERSMEVRVMRPVWTHLIFYFHSVVDT